MQKKLHMAAIAQLGERQTEDLKVPGSIPGLGIARGLLCPTEVCSRIGSPHSGLMEMHARELQKRHC